ncbi:MAG: hypothetical protein HPY53_06100 [Brevinematales bacterium]|nr:hypothetical protein [Brevinematales bacterium]
MTAQKYYLTRSITAALLLLFLPAIAHLRTVYYEAGGVSIDLPQGWKANPEGGVLYCESLKNNMLLTLETLSSNGFGTNNSAPYKLLEWYFRQTFSFEFAPDDYYEEETGGMYGFAMTGTYQDKTGKNSLGYCGILGIKEGILAITLTGSFAGPVEFHQLLTRLLSGLQPVPTQ